MVEIARNLSVDASRVESIGPEQGDTGPSFFYVIMDSGQKHAADVGVMGRAEFAHLVEEEQRWGNLRAVAITERQHVNIETPNEKRSTWYAVFHRFTSDGHAIVEDVESGEVRTVDPECVRFRD